jgi:orotidine-5'-phosphate decarboxylase
MLDTLDAQVLPQEVGRHPQMLSTKPIPVNERLIFALDVPTVKEAKDLVEKLGDSVDFYKLGLELFMADGYSEMLDWLAGQNKKTLVDLKFFDVPNTVGSAIRRLSDHNPTFATVHGNEQMLRAACSASNGIKILAVTVLTSFDKSDLVDFGFPKQIDVPALVLSRAARALDAGCEGVISSGLEAEELRDQLGESFLIVVPGIRPFENNEIEGDDQKRVVGVEEAFQKGADYIVVGRPIRTARDPKVAAQKIQDDISQLFNP